MTVLWTTEDLPGAAFDPEPDDEDDTPNCRIPGVLPEQTTVNVTASEEYL